MVGNSKNKLNILIIGVGNMGGSLIDGLLLSKEKYSIKAFDVASDKLSRWKFGVEYVDLKKKNDLKSLDVIFFCIKPQDFTEFCKQRFYLDRRTLVVSTLAGKTIAQIASELKFTGPIVRCMPNIAATVSEAATALARNELVNDGHAQLIDSIFSSIGTAH